MQFETLAHLKNFLNSLSEDELKQPCRFWGDSIGGTITGAQILSEDYINPSGEGCEPVSAYADEPDYEEAYADEPVVLQKGAIIFEVDRGSYRQNSPTFESVFEDFGQFAVKTFEAADAFSTMEKLRDEAGEVQGALVMKVSGNFSRSEFTKELADCVLCIIHGAKKEGIMAFELVHAMHHKTQVNKKRKWKLNPNNTYSHIKE